MFKFQHHHHNRPRSPSHTYTGIPQSRYLLPLNHEACRPHPTSAHTCGPPTCGRVNHALYVNKVPRQLPQILRLQISLPPNGGGSAFKDVERIWQVYVAFDVDFRRFISFSVESRSRRPCYSQIMRFETSTFS